MCGITGGISLKVSFDFSQEVNLMNSAIAHRGPDGEGFFKNDSGTVYFGHRRLAIIDLTEMGHQPMLVNGYAITYNGEVYNYLELKKELESLGVIFKSNSDTEVILNAYIKWGQSCVNKFNGMWAFAIYDPLERIVFCSRDRFGIKPFYFTILDNRLYFSSEIKAFLQLKGWKSVLNLSRSYDFLANSLVSHTDQTMLQGVNELRGGHNLVISLKSGEVCNTIYYDCSNEYSNNIQTQSVSYFEQLFRDAVKLTLRSDVKVGSALSGGIDSSTIVSIVNDQLKNIGEANQQECVSACFTNEDKGINESEYIDILSKFKQFKAHKVYPNFDHLLNNLDKIIWAQDEPFPTLSIYAQFSVFEEASKRNLKVMLDGQGADEILAGYESFYEAYFKELWKDNPLELFPAIFNYFVKHSVYPFDKIINKLIPKKSNDSWFNQQFISAITPYTRNQPKSVRAMSEDYLKNFGLHSLLKYEDRNSMAFSVESRVPFLDFRIVEYALNLPTNLKINKGIRKYVLRESFKNILPTVIYNRYDKLGFPTPQERWTISNAGKIDQLLHESLLELKDLFSINSFRNSLKLLQRGDSSFIFLSWRIILFARWKRQYQVNIKL
jgi:asparagine synthase (glutamine-hydrolysing)